MNPATVVVYPTTFHHHEMDGSVQTRFGIVVQREGREWCWRDAESVEAATSMLALAGLRALLDRLAPGWDEPAAPRFVLAAGVEYAEAELPPRAPQSGPAQGAEGGAGDVPS